MKQDAINALHELAGEAQDNGNSSVWIARRVELIKAALEQSAVEPAMLNTCLSNAKQEPAQAVPVGRVLHWKGEPGLAPKTCIRGFDEFPKGFARLGPWEEGENVYTAQPAIDEKTRKMVLDEFPLLDEEGLSETGHPAEWAIQQDRKRLHKMLKRLEAGE